MQGVCGHDLSPLGVTSCLISWLTGVSPDGSLSISQSLRSTDGGFPQSNFHRGSFITGNRQFDRTVIVVMVVMKPQAKGTFSHACARAEALSRGRVNPLQVMYSGHIVLDYSSNHIESYTFDTLIRPGCPSTPLLPES